MDDAVTALQILDLRQIKRLETRFTCLGDVKRLCATTDRIVGSDFEAAKSLPFMGSLLRLRLEWEDC
jgi:hypothetical protein